MLMNHELTVFGARPHADHHPYGGGREDMPIMFKSPTTGDLESQGLCMCNIYTMQFNTSQPTHSFVVSTLGTVWQGTVGTDPNW